MNHYEIVNEEGKVLRLVRGDKVVIDGAFVVISHRTEGVKAAVSSRFAVIAR